jgi:hypothetical protein
MVLLETIYLQFFVLKSIEVKRMNLRESHDVLSFKKAPPLVKNFIGSLSSAILELSCVAYRSKSCKKKHFGPPLNGIPPPKTHAFRVWPTIFGWRRDYRLFRIFSVYVFYSLLIMLINW